MEHHCAYAYDLGMWSIGQLVSRSLASQRLNWHSYDETGWTLKDCSNCWINFGKWGAGQPPLEFDTFCDLPWLGLQIDVVLVLDSEGLHAALCKLWVAQRWCSGMMVDVVGSISAVPIYIDCLKKQTNQTATSRAIQSMDELNKYRVMCMYSK